MSYKLYLISSMALSHATKCLSLRTSNRAYYSEPRQQIMPRHPSQRLHGSSFVIFPALVCARQRLHFTFWPSGLHLKQQTQACVSADWANIRAVRRGIASDWKTHATVRHQQMSFISSIMSREKVTRRSNTLVGFQWRLQVFNFWENASNQSKYLSGHWSRHQWKAPSYWEPTIIYFLKSDEDGKLLATGYNAGTGPYGKK